MNKFIDNETVLPVKSKKYGSIASFGPKTPLAGCGIMAQPTALKVMLDTDDKIKVWRRCYMHMAYPKHLIIVYDDELRLVRANSQ